MTIPHEPESAGHGPSPEPVEGDAVVPTAQDPPTMDYRTLAEALLAQSNAVNTGLLFVTPGGTILNYNRRFAEQWGFEASVLGAQSDDAALAAAVERLEDSDAFLERVRYLYEHPDEESTDELRFRDGRILERFSAPVRADDGTYFGRLWSFRDVTHQRELERSLERRAAEQAALYRFTDRLHHARSLDDVYDAAIEAIMRALGCDRASLLQFDEHDFMGFVAWRGLSDTYRAAVNGHTPWTPGEIDAEPITVGDIQSSDLEPELKQTVLGEGIRAFAFIPLVGSDRLLGKFMVYYDTPHTFSDDEVNLALTVARQIAFGIERRRADEERERAEAALREAGRRKDEFLATLAHELRNPLSPMHNALPLLERKVAAGEDPAPLLEILSRQTTRLARLVDDLMDVSRITRGHVDLRREPLDLATVTRRAVEAVAEHPGRSELTIDVELPDGSVFVSADAVRIEQVIHNLLANAVKYTEPGGRIHVVLRTEGDDAVLCVRDTGVGIDPAFIDHVFDLFRQADPSLDRTQGGLGIGLTVARQLVELHGGSIEAHSPGIGAGSEFVVRLPVASVTEQPEVARAPRPTDVETRRRVLVVDDNPDQTAVLGELILDLGHDVCIASDGAEALARAREFRPDIVLLDVGLPHMDGYETAMHFRADPTQADVLLVALTGYSQPADHARSTAAGFDAHVVKPISLESLEHLLTTGTPPTGSRPPNSMPPG